MYERSNIYIPLSTILLMMFDADEAPYQTQQRMMTLNVLLKPFCLAVSSKVNGRSIVSLKNTFFLY